MARTDVRDDPTGPIPTRAVNYTLKSDGSYAASRVWDRAYAGGVSNVHTSIEDLTKWDRNFFSPTVGNEALIRTVYSPGRLNSGKSTAYAYGLAPATHRGMLTISHSGVGGGSFFLLRMPEQRLSVATLCNRYGVGPGAPDIWNLSHAVADIFLNNAAKPDPSKTAVALAPAIAVPDSELAKHVGSYWHIDGPPISIKLEKGQLVQMYEGKPYPMVPLGSLSALADERQDAASPINIIAPRIEQIPAHIEELAPLVSAHHCVRHYVGQCRFRYGLSHCWHRLRSPCAERSPESVH